MVFHHIEQQLKSMTGHQWTLLGFKNKVAEVYITHITVVMVMSPSHPLYQCNVGQVCTPLQ